MFNIIIEFLSSSYLMPFYMCCTGVVLLGFCSVLIKGTFYEVLNNV